MTNRSSNAISGNSILQCLFQTIHDLFANELEAQLFHVFDIWLYFNYAGSPLRLFLTLTD